ncbi:MAG TPA: helix-turn-helix transcriptional regulator [Leptospiraceae bacterium]|nr:helix-turn-helix transcriptional regulator [Leptospiraceae bacterium]HMX35140.1 helix-turn-helix transcriptional regulator [Leptospiraceae bacterium]HMY34043.1 helix-turn-helix transcriptional regulator [Leptospiraceae bacterium]HMZ67155.1 helix-turn-helix transcriptional regulator [Leptospiraceae bacterium]HNA09420.1 helix-turn-helix transcriptional regulator [Leptospiraceae bacterium]
MLSIVINLKRYSETALRRKLKDKKFKEYFDAEKEYLNLSIQIAKYREAKGISQKDLAVKAKITQQQLSKIENGINCNITTFLKVCSALDIKIDFQKKNKRAVAG